MKLVCKIYRVSEGLIVDKAYYLDETPKLRTRYSGIDSIGTVLTPGPEGGGSGGSSVVLCSKGESKEWDRTRAENE